MIYSWEKGFIKDKVAENTQSPKKKILREDELRKSGQALTKPIQGRISAETCSTKNVGSKTSAGSNYRKPNLDLSKTRGENKSPSAEPHKKLQRISFG